MTPGTYLAFKQTDNDIQHQEVKNSILNVKY